MFAELPINSIASDPDQPRKAFDRTGIDRLAQSIKSHGLMNPITVRHHPEQDGKHMLVSGERRLRACKLLQLSTVPCIVVDMQGDQLRAAQLVENLQREDLSLADLMRSVTALVKMSSPAQVAKQLGRSESWVSRHNQLDRWADAVRGAVLDGELADVSLAADLNGLFKLSTARATELLEQHVSGALQLTRAMIREESAWLKEQAEKAAELERMRNTVTERSGPVTTPPSTQAQPPAAAAPEPGPAPAEPAAPSPDPRTPNGALDELAQQQSEAADKKRRSAQLEYQRERKAHLNSIAGELISAAGADDLGHDFLEAGTSPADNDRLCFTCGTPDTLLKLAQALASLGPDALGESGAVSIRIDRHPQHHRALIQAIRKASAGKLQGKAPRKRTGKGGSLTVPDDYRAMFDAFYTQRIRPNAERLVMAADLKEALEDFAPDMKHSAQMIGAAMLTKGVDKRLRTGRTCYIGIELA